MSEVSNTFHAYALQEVYIIAVLFHIGLAYGTSQFVMAFYTSSFCCQLLLLIGVESAFDPVVYPFITKSSSTTDCQADNALFDDQLLEAITTAHQRLPPRGCLRTARKSCVDILYCNSSASSGYYQIQAVNGSQVEVYCDMEGTNCGGEGGWTRVAYLNMTDTSSQCPTNFRSVSENGQHFCIRDHVGCVALPSETLGITYSQVCGFARGYTYLSPDAFYGDDISNNAVRGLNEPVSGNYVDGVSITYGAPSRHVWTYAAGGSEDGNQIASYNCPCNSNINRIPVPAYVGNDFYCEAGKNSGTTGWYVGDPLWDGEMCGGTEGPCCNHTGLPWFIKQLPNHTLGNIGVRLCADQETSDENIGLEHLAVFVK